MKRPFISLNSSAFIENLSSSEGGRTRARTYHAKNDAQKGCGVQLNEITLRQYQPTGNTKFLGGKSVKSQYTLYKISSS